MATIRSASPLRKIEEDEELSFNTNKMTALIKSAEERARPHTVWRHQELDCECSQRLDTVVHLLSQEGHFKMERIDAKKSKVDTQGSKFKRPNVTQQKEARQKPMPALTGLIAFSKLVQARNMLDLEEELLFRGGNSQECAKPKEDAPGFRNTALDRRRNG